ncbi:LysM peptidoglycan-binding domain-containing protein [Anoxybacillus flavithermus]|uniref:Stage VI sporulation protein D (LysM domain) n=1 Tax=Anoxybacillus flavithermus AK1 TaxID=1297581 RepID=M8D686_9BACL|nr:LysM peptidoglycan-binding domain-containing protein [Anoxybacillus flavithermus]EMT46362.1 stage VI sporulation protein D (LysM domain) [Anoxybacillus flavithermus AK1]
MLRFSIEEAIAFRREHHVDQLLSISLQPTITIEEQEDYVYIRGVLELSGEYTKHEEDGEDVETFELGRYIEQVRMHDEETGEFLHQFPIDVTVPKERVDDLEQVYVLIESFDYDLRKNELRLIAEVAIHGIQMDDDREDEEEWDAYNVDDFEPFEAVDRQEVYEEEKEEQETIANVPTFYMLHEEQVADDDEHKEERIDVQGEHEEEQVDTQKGYEEEQESKREETSFQLELKGRETNEKRNENALYLTKLFGKNEEQAFARLKICIVQQGDSLDKIAERYDVSVQQLLRTNHLESGADVHEGQLLYIPTPSKV